ncbi:MAG TPA: hypothetical protein PLI41_07820 [Bacteroidales bacterium]|nr:hypothetical protein [Bacteroidales bacterium]HQB37435.1 hypothetical protein [Bacteroidales bacterium]
MELKETKKHKTMKQFPISLAVFLIVILAGCSGRGTSKQNAVVETDTVIVPDTGYTGIKQYMSGNLKVKEVTFKNGVRQGLTKTFYQSGELYQTFWYENDIREDTGRYYFKEGQIFRETPYKRDTIDGIQIQYYRGGQVRAKIGFSKGKRTPYLEEFNSNGKLFRDYPEIVVNVTDEYNSKGIYRIGLELSDKKTRVDFYRGEFINNMYDTSMYKAIKQVDGIARLDLRKSGKPGQNYVGIIASMLTPFGNRNLVYKRIELPYNDLN